MPVITSVNWSWVDFFSVLLRLLFRLPGFTFFNRQLHCQWTMEQAGNKTLCGYCWVNIATVMVFSLLNLLQSVSLCSYCNLILNTHSADLEVRVIGELIWFSHLPLCPSWVCRSPTSCVMFFVTDWISACSTWSLSVQGPLSHGRRFTCHC